ncbi:MAG: cbb3-type cytochrome c oxidase subunit I [Syntrophobacterales bacterium]|nr:MAG: cbb3-type cytochrome c oxidase subunit I [Syntrophobacterales bacterium]
MDRYARCFVKASLIYLAIGVILGVMMVANADWTPRLGRPHNHVNLVGFVSFMIFGVGYHILPRFTGRPLHSGKLADLHLWLANIGLIGMSIFWVLDAGFERYAFELLTILYYSPLS